MDNLERIRQLSAEATALKTKDIGAAIEALKQAQALAQQGGISQTIEWWLRLPLFLQAAGRVEESDAAFAQQVHDSEERYAREFAHRRAKDRKGLWHGAMATLHEKWALACRRSGRADKAAGMDKLREQHHQKWKAWNEAFMAELDKPRKRASWRS